MLKMPLTAGFVNADPADNNHRWAKHNEWDIGATFDSPYVWLFGLPSSISRRKGVHRFPMLNPGSLGFGSANLNAW